MWPRDEILTPRATVIGGKKWPDDYTVIWRSLPIGRIMLAPGLPPHVPQWRWTCNFYGKPEGRGSGSGDDLDDCKRQFKAAWAIGADRRGHRLGIRDAAVI